MRAERSVSIPRPPREVFAFLADAENDPRWRPGVLDIARQSGTGVGTVYRQGIKGPMGRRIPADVEITAFEPDSAIEFKGIAGPVRPHGRYSLRAEGSGTLLTFALDAELRGIRGAMMARAVGRSMRAETAAIENIPGALDG